MWVSMLEIINLFMRHEQAKLFVLKALQKTTGLKDLMAQQESTQKKRFKARYVRDFSLG